MINRFVSNVTHALQPFGLLLVRLVMAAVFLPAGYGKLMNMTQSIAYFDSIGIPLAQVVVPLVAILEIAGAVALAFGVFTELFAFLLMGIMIGAVVFAKHADIENFRSLLSMADVLYGLLLMLLSMIGPGKIAVHKTGN